MSIAPYLKEIGRGKDGARALTREQAADLFGQLLDGRVSDLELGAFCLAMRIKGETPEELAGFLDAIGARCARVPSAAGAPPLVVLPSYNGARKLPCLTPLLALLLAREGLPVLLHGHASEDQRVSASQVLEALGQPAAQAVDRVAPGQVCHLPLTRLCAPLARLLDVRRVLGLRNSAHSLVKLLAPGAGTQLLITSYTHPEYARSMRATCALTGTPALLLRGTEGEAVADPRRTPRMEWVAGGAVHTVDPGQDGPLTRVPDLPAADAAATAAWTRAVLDGHQPVPAPLARQVQHVLAAARSLRPGAHSAAARG